MSELWPRWQGHVINGVGRLGGCLGYSDHSGVFLTESATRTPPVVAVKLVPTNRALTKSILPRWRRAAGLSHTHLIRMWDFGGCQLDGLPHLYIVLEYADQTLAQVLLRRALTDTEAREMLMPALDALTFIHGQNLVHGELKPANILVVGDQLKLASDTVRRAREEPARTHGPTRYDAPEVREGRSSPASDIWALGVTLFEALTRRPASDLGEPSEAIALPGDFPAAFRNVVTRCLSPSPQERPGVSELLAWVAGKSSLDAPAHTILPTAVTTQLETAIREPEALRTAPPPVAPEGTTPGSTNAHSQKSRTVLIVLLAGIGILALAWGGRRVFSTARNAPAPPPATSAAAQPIVPAPKEPRAPTTDAPAHAAVVHPAISAPSTPTQSRADVAATPPSALHEEIPEIPRSARQTIRGHIKVWVRIIVDQNGSVLATAADRTGPSRYFLRLAVEAAKKWQFPPAQSPSQRLMQVRFDFSRDGATGHAVTLP